MDLRLDPSWTNSDGSEKNVNAVNICEKNIKLEDWFYVNKLINRVDFLKKDDFLLDKRRRWSYLITIYQILTWLL
jgi:hypothetical protein